MNIGDYPCYPRYLCSTPSITVVCVARDEGQLRKANAEVSEHAEPGAFWADEPEAVAFAVSFFQGLGLEEYDAQQHAEVFRSQLRAAPDVEELLKSRRAPPGQAKKEEPKNDG